MKTKLLLGLTLLVTLGMSSCKKDKDKPKDPNTITIGNSDYAMVKVGDQTWTAENYSGEGGVYYNNDAANASLGKLYTVEEARAVVVPQGWRLPTLEDYEKLLTEQGITLVPNGEGGRSDNNSWAGIQKFMTTTGWKDNQGTNTTGFNALPTGEGYGNGEFGRKGEATAFWASKGTGNELYYIGFFRHSPPTSPYRIYYNPAYNNKCVLRFVKSH